MTAQRENALPLTPFYEVQGADLSKPGALVRAEAGTGYNLPGGVTATRIAYASRNVSGEPVLATGVVLVPSGEPPAGGWPVIAWAHGTAGVARVCAPSLMKDIYYGWRGLFLYPLMGYAVVATDYAGLGTPGPHQLLWLEAQGQDVVNAIPAARAAIPSLGKKWVAVGIKAADPSFDQTSMLGPEVMKLIPQLESEYCFAAATELVEKTPGASQPRNWPDANGVRRFTQANRPYLEHARGPLLVLLGGNDPAIPLDITRRSIGQRCALNQTVALKVYPGMNHREVIHASFRTQMKWIEDRFAGRPAERACPIK